MTIGIISHPECLLHEMGPFHPECPERIQVIDHALRQADFSQDLRFYEALLASKEQVSLAHDKAYIDRIFKYAPKQGRLDLDPDTSMNPHTLQAALYAAGSVIQAVDLVMKQQVNQCFCNVRPPGHHAEHNKAMGFCFFNNIAIGARYAMQTYHLNKIAIIDFDVHHGNGTEDIFKDEPKVLFCSSFQFPYYPFNTVVQNNPHILHIPLNAGSEPEAFQKMVKSHFLPVLHAFDPEFIFISAGFDAHREDPLANLNFTENDYYWISKEIFSIANLCCDGKIVSALEGGYNLDVLGNSVVAHLRAFTFPEDTRES